MWTSVIQAVSRQCFQMCAVKNPISPGLGKLEFLKLRIRALSVPYFFHVYISE